MQERLNGSGEAYVSSTTLDDRVALRLALLSPRTTLAHVDAVVDVVAASLASPTG